MRFLPLCAMSLALAPHCATAHAPSGDDGIEVAVGEPFTIAGSKGHHNFPTLKQMSEKELFVAIWASPDASLPPEQCNVAVVWTRDGGRTWDKPVMFHGSQVGGHSWVRRRDGTCLWLSYFCRAARTSPSSPATWAGPPTDGPTRGPPAPCPCPDRRCRGPTATRT